MTQPETILVGGKIGIIDALYALQDYYDFDIVYTPDEHKFILTYRPAK